MEMMEIWNYRSCFAREGGVPRELNHHHHLHLKNGRRCCVAASTDSLPAPSAVPAPLRTSNQGHLTSILKTPKLTIKPLLSRRAWSGGARMANTAFGSYATALADLAKSNNTLERTFSDVEKIAKIFFDESVLRFFTNPTIGDGDKRTIVDEIAKSSALQPHVTNFLNVLLDMKRIDLVKEIVKEFESVYNDMTATEVAVVTSVVKLEPQHLAQIAKGVQKLTKARNVRIKTAIDPSLVAGFTIRYGNSGSKLIYMSVKKQIEEIAAQLDLGDIHLAV